MILGREVVGVSDRGVVFVEKPVARSRARKVALKAVGSFVDVVTVGKIRALFVDDPVFPLGCSPNYGSNGKYETARHCIMYGDICRVRGEVNMSDGGKATVLGYSVFNACRSLVCWIFARWLNKFGWINDGCVEEWDNAWLNRGNEGRFPDMVLFAGSEDGRLALFVRGMLSAAEGGKLPHMPFRVRVQSVDYWGSGGPRVVNWETDIGGTGLFLIWFGSYVLPFRAYYSYPAGVRVKPGFSGSAAFLV